MVLVNSSEISGCEDPQALQHCRVFWDVQECYRAVIPASCPLLHKGALTDKAQQPQIRHRPDRKEGGVLKENDLHQKLSCYLQTLAFITYGSKNECKIFLSNLNMKPY